MAQTDNTPTFNLKAVVQETGLKPDTLRAWERRYGLPTPKRTSGRHRLYSQRDIDILKWLIARQKEGLTISRAVDMWRKLVSDGADPFVAMAPPAPVAAAPPPRIGGETLAGLRRAWIAACLDYDERQAEAILTQAFALFPPDMVALDLLRAALAEIGDGWHRGDVTAQQEHFASGLAMRRLEALVAAAPPPTRPARILVGCPPDEVHTFSPLLLTYLLRRRGWHTIYLGANVPLVRFQATLEQVKPDLVILVAQLLHTAASLNDMAALLAAERIPLAFGGLVFTLTPDLAARIPGHYLGDRLDAAPATIENLLATSPAPVAPAEHDRACERSLAHFQEQQPLIGARVWELIKPNGKGISAQHLSIANTHFGQSIAAALRLGDVRFLGSDIGWIQSLMAERDMPPQALTGYLRAYHQAASEHLGEPGQPILSWLENAITN